MTSSRLSQKTINLLERFVVLMYNRTSSATDINECRYEYFVHKQKRMEYLPPTRDALILYIKRATYQGGFVWGKALEVKPELPNLNEWG